MERKGSLAAPLSKGEPSVLPKALVLKLGKYKTFSIIILILRCTGNKPLESQLGGELATGRDLSTGWEAKEFLLLLPDKVSHEDAEISTGSDWYSA